MNVGKSQGKRVRNTKPHVLLFHKYFSNYRAKYFPTRVTPKGWFILNFFLWANEREILFDDKNHQRFIQKADFASPQEANAEHFLARNYAEAAVTCSCCMLPFIENWEEAHEKKLWRALSFPKGLISQWCWAAWKLSSAARDEGNSTFIGYPNVFDGVVVFFTTFLRSSIPHFQFSILYASFVVFWHLKALDK